MGHKVTKEGKKIYEEAQSSGVLNLRFSSLDEVPAEAYALQNIWKFDATKNGITECPDGLKRCKLLRDLKRFVHLPIATKKQKPGYLAQLRQLIGPRNLILAQNQLAILPEGLGHLKRLTLIDFTHNRLTALPASLGNLPVLQTVLVAHNQLAALPDSFCGLDRLTHLDLRANPIAALPPSLTKLSATLFKLELQDTPLWARLEGHADYFEEGGQKLDTAKALAFLCSGARSSEGFLHRMFAKYDTDQSESIDVGEFKNLCYDFGHYLTDEQVGQQFALLDSEGDGQVSYTEFEAWWAGQGFDCDDAALRARSHMAAVFQAFDRDRNGVIDGAELRPFYETLYDKGLTAAVYADCIAQFDQNQDGAIQFREFATWVNAGPERLDRL